MKSTTPMPRPVGAADRVWPGRVDLYRAGTFASQRDPTWCTAAASQMMFNLVSHRTDSSKANQAAYYAYGYLHRAYAFVEPGLDPAAWVAILAHFGNLNYRIVAESTPAEVLRVAARQLRVTGYPVGLVVGRHGDHSWVMTGFTATADPARANAFEVTGIWALGPYWPEQSYYRGVFDSPPHTFFSAAQLSWIMDRYSDKLGPTIWDGNVVAVVPES